MLRSRTGFEYNVKAVRGARVIEYLARSNFDWSKFLAIFREKFGIDATLSLSLGYKFSGRDAARAPYIDLLCSEDYKVALRKVIQYKESVRTKGVVLEVCDRVSSFNLFFLSVCADRS